MAQKPIREAMAKSLLREHWNSDISPVPAIQFAEITTETNLESLSKEHSWLTEGKIVVKADELFGKRGKRGYVFVTNSWEDTKNWMSEKRGTVIEVDGKNGLLNHFIIEPFIEHTDEYYVSIAPGRTEDIISYSPHGGVEVEEQTDITHIHIQLEETPTLSELPEEIRPTVLGLLDLYRRLNFGSIEINPLVHENGTSYLLDCVARLDSCSAFQQRVTWGTEELPEGFGIEKTAEEIFIATLDAKSGSSLKFTLLNPKGHVWTMVAGGGASIIYADSIVKQVPPSELVNYGEWSGNPSTDEMDAYTSTILSLITINPEPQVLIIGGGIANFTDVPKTFAGVIRALEKHKDNLKQLKIFVRRAGPRDSIGLKNLQEACDNFGLYCETYDSSLPMTDIIEKAVSNLNLTPIEAN